MELDDAALAYAAQRLILHSNFAELIKNPAIIKLVQADVDQINQELAGFEAIRKFTILPNDFTIESGELTPSLKVKRGVVIQRNRPLIDAMYGGPTPA